MKRLVTLVGAFALGLTVLATTAFVAYADDTQEVVEEVSTVVGQSFGSGPQGVSRGSANRSPEFAPVAARQMMDEEVHAIFEAQLHEALSSLFGISVDEFEARIAEGATLVDLMTEYDVTPEAVAEARATARSAAIDEALALGLITADEAAQLSAAPAGGPRGFGDGTCDGPLGGGMNGRGSGNGQGLQNGGGLGQQNGGGQGLQNGNGNGQGA